MGKNSFSIVHVIVFIIASFRFDYNVWDWVRVQLFKSSMCGLDKHLSHQSCFLGALSAGKGVTVLGIFNWFEICKSYFYSIPYSYSDLMVANICHWDFASVLLEYCSSYIDMIETILQTERLKRPLLRKMYKDTLHPCVIQTLFIAKNFFYWL